MMCDKRKAKKTDNSDKEVIKDIQDASQNPVKRTRKMSEMSMRAFQEASNEGKFTGKKDDMRGMLRDDLGARVRKFSEMSMTLSIAENEGKFTGKKDDFRGFRRPSESHSRRSSNASNHSRLPHSRKSSVGSNYLFPTDPKQSPQLHKREVPSSPLAATPSV
jgi:hypothetical protein